VALIGTAGWAIPAPYRDRFPAAGTQLERYAARLPAVEINSSFYRPHRCKTYARWAASVPDNFRFSVKLPRTITQDKRLRDCDAEMARFCGEVAGLDGKLGMVLVQLPPSLPFDAGVARDFFSRLCDTVPAACEPRHASWFAPEADALLRDLHVPRVAADPPRAPGDGVPGGWTGTAYWRLHGSPKIYYSDYPEETLQAMAPKLRAKDWCIFDNTAAFAALGNALNLAALRGA